MLAWALVISAAGHSAAGDPLGVVENTKVLLAPDVGLLTEPIGTDAVKITVSLPSLGWIGFGISGNGGMRGADIVVVSRNAATGEFIALDMFADNYSQPVVDPVQSITLLAASRNETHTTATISRRLAACDSADLPIGRGELVNFIWAWGATDRFVQHLPMSRGLRKLVLLDAPAARRQSLAPMVETSPPPDPGRVVVDVRMPADMDIPLTDYYRCVAVELPADLVARGNGSLWLLGGFPRVETAFVHHIIIFGCDGDAAPFNGTKTCFGSAGDECQAFYVAWAPGSSGTWVPGNAAFRLRRWVAMQIHYSNPTAALGQRDHSGMALHITPFRRPIVAGVAVAGVPHFAGLIALPPRRAPLLVKGVCPARALTLSPAFPRDGVVVWDVFLHGHTRLRDIRLQVARNGTLLPLGLDPYYDFHHQGSMRLNPPFRLLPGDTLHTTCMYDTRGDSQWVTGGESTGEEMCYAFFTFTPELTPGALLPCLSMTVPLTGGSGVLALLPPGVTVALAPLPPQGRADFTYGGFNITLLKDAELLEPFPPPTPPDHSAMDMCALAPVTAAGGVVGWGAFAAGGGGGAGGWPAGAVAAVVVLAVLLVVAVAAAVVLALRSPPPPTTTVVEPKPAPTPPPSGGARREETGTPPDCKSPATVVYGESAGSIDSA